MRVWSVLLMPILMSPASAAVAIPTISTEQLPGLRPATVEERAGISEVLNGTNILYDFARGEFQVHDGDLHVPGHFVASDWLLVRGDLRVDGVYDDSRGWSYGLVAVLGDMKAEHISSKASLYVQGDLRVDGVIVTSNNDFSLEVGGLLHASGLVVEDKGAYYKTGELGFLFDDDYFGHDEPTEEELQRFENGLRRLRPELISSPRGRNEIGPRESIHQQPVDHDAVRKAMHEGRPLLRATEAPADMPRWLKTAIDFETDEASLLALIGKDPLVDQLMAAREQLSATVAEALARGGDPIVLEWLSQSYPKIAERHVGGITATE